jgi:hypothetical protein
VDIKTEDHAIIDTVDVLASCVFWKRKRQRIDEHHDDRDGKQRLGLHAVWDVGFVGSDIAVLRNVPWCPWLRVAWVRHIRAPLVPGRYNIEDYEGRVDPSRDRGVK